MSGGLRCFKETFPFTEKFILSQYDCDLFFYGVVNYEGQKQNYKDFLELYKPKDVVINENDYYYSIVDKLPHVWDKKHNVVSMFYNIYMCNELRKKTNVAYDMILRVRPDCFFTKNIPSEDIQKVYDNKILIPGCWSFCGFSDLFAMANHNIFDIYASIYNNLKQYFSEHITSAERIVKEHCNKNCLEVCSIDKYMEFEFPDSLTDLENITFINAGSRNLKYNYDKK